MGNMVRPVFHPCFGLRLLFLALVFGLTSGSSQAAPPPPPPEIQKAITDFFGLLKADKVDAAYDVVLTNTKIKGREDEVKALKKQTHDAVGTYGPILGFEIIEQKRVGMSLMQVVCLSWSENFPLRWRFSYYRPGDKWRLIDIFVDDKVGELFDGRVSRVTSMDAPSP